MQYQTVTEFSSNNDYPENLPTNYSKQAVTLQFHQRKMPCFNYIKTKLETYFSQANIVLPPYGYYPSGYQYDRPGPAGNRAYDETVVLDKRLNKKVESIPQKSIIKVLVGDREISNARIYNYYNNQLMYLGVTGNNGELTWFNPTTGSEIIAYFNYNYHTYRQKLEVSVLKSEFLIQPDVQISDNTRKSYDPDTSSVGICISGDLEWDKDFLINLNLNSDASLDTFPVIVAYLGYVIDTFRISYFDDNMTNFIASYSFKDTLFTYEGFDGSGFLNISYRHENKWEYATTYFKIFPVSDERASMHYNRSFNLNIGEENILEPELGISFTTYGMPAGIIGKGIYPVTDVFSFNLENTSSFTEGAGINVQFNIDPASGIDYSSLGMYKMNSASGGWEIMEESFINIKDHIASYLSPSTGIFCLMADNLTSDSIAPERIKDLSAKTGNSQYMIELTWTVPVDSPDDNIAYYIIRYNDVPINHLNWDQSLDLYDMPDPLNKGDIESLNAKMPLPNKIYYFAIRSVDFAGNVSEISNYTSAISATQKYTFSLINPAFNDTLGNLTPLFIWEPVSEENVKYTLFLDTDPLFVDPSVIEDLEDPEYQATDAITGDGFYFWKVIAVLNGSDTILCNQSYFRFISKSTTAIPEISDSRIKGGYFYPNPFNPDNGEGSLRFTLDEPGIVNIAIYNIDGQKVTEFNLNYPNKGAEYVVHWTGEGSNKNKLPNGIYIYQLIQNNVLKLSGKILITK